MSYFTDNTNSVNIPCSENTLHCLKFSVPFFLVFRFAPPGLFPLRRSGPVIRRSASRRNEPPKLRKTRAPIAAKRESPWRKQTREKLFESATFFIYTNTKNFDRYHSHFIVHNNNMNYNIVAYMIFFY